MTLDEAIMEVVRVTQGPGEGGIWTGDDFSAAQPEYPASPVDDAIAIILNAVVSGQLKVVRPS